MKKLLYSLIAFVVSVSCAFAQVQNTFGAVVMTATNQTSAALPFTQYSNVTNIPVSYTSGTLTITGTALTTATVGVLGSSDGVNYFPINISSITAPSTVATTTTVTANGLFSMAGPTRVNSSFSAGTIGGSNFFNGSVTAPVFACTTGAGTGCTTPATTSGFLDTFTEGSITFSTGTGPSNVSGLFTISGLTRTNKPVCMGLIAPVAGGTTQTLIPSVTTSVQTFFAAVTLTASTSYIASYICHGN